MLYSKRSLGVDGEGASLTLVALARRLRDTVVLDWLSLPEAQSEEARRRVGEFLDRNRLRDAPVTACLPRAALVVRFLDLPAEAEPQLRNVIAYQIDTLHPFPSGQVNWDCAVVAREAKTRQIRVMVVLAEKHRLVSYRELLTGLGLTADSLTLAAACLAPLLGPLVPEAGVLVVGRRQGVELIGFHQGRLSASRELPAEPTENVAERWQRELHSLRALLPVGDPTAVPAFVCGTLPGAFAGLVASPLPALSLPLAAPPSFNLVEHLPALAAAYTGLQRKLAPAINLLPPAERRRPLRQLRVPTYALAVTAAVLALAALGHGWIEAGLYARALDRQIQRLEPQAQAASQQAQQASRLEERAALLEAEGERTWRQLRLLQELTRVLPDGTWLQEVQLGEEAAEIYGYSDRAAELVATLESSSYFAQVELAAPITRDAQNKEVFRMRMRLESPPNR